MSEGERCPVCGGLKARTLDQLSESGYCWRSYEYCCKTYPYRQTIARLESALAAAQFENEAWRALAEWCAHRPQRRINHQELFGQVSVSAQDGVGNERTSDWALTPGLAAVDLSRKLNLIAPAGKETT
jgi:hypothetical protein